MDEFMLPPPDDNGIIKALASELSEENKLILNTFGKYMFFYDFMQENVVVRFFHKANPRRHRKIMAALISPIKNSRVLDIACGAGGAIRYFDKSNEYTGIDLSYSMLIQSLKRAKKKSFMSYTIVEGNAEEPLFENNSFDFVLVETALHMIPNYRNAIAQIARALDNGGLFVAAVPTIGISEKFDANWKKIADKYLLHSLTVDDIKTVCFRNGLNFTQYDTNGGMLYFQAHKEAAVIS